MFKFSFNEPPPPSTPALLSPPKKPPSPTNKPHKLPFSPPPPLSTQPHDIIPIGPSQTLFRKSTATAPSHLSPSNADIVPTTYEGGYKLWECAFDLTNHLLSPSAPPLSNKSVLELGAGHAFPSIVAGRAGARIIHIQDYNADVLRDVSMANVAANVPDHEARFSYFAGSWQGLPALLDGMYDVVLSADTVYASEQVEQLARCVVMVLKPGGVALVAGKAYYFGVGGGTRAFLRRIVEIGREVGKDVCAEVVEEVRDGVSNVREMVRVREVSSGI